MQELQAETEACQARENQAQAALSAAAKESGSVRSERDALTASSAALQAAVTELGTQNAVLAETIVNQRRSLERHSTGTLQTRTHETRQKRGR